MGRVLRPALLRSALVLMALGVGSIADARPATRKAKAEEAAEPAPPTMEERQAVFGAIDEAFKAGRKAQVADLLVEVVENPDHAVFHAEAYARLAGVLESLDLPFAALMAHERALATDADLASGSAKKAIALADKVGDTALLEKVFAANVGLDVDDATRSRMAYLAAREAHAKNNLGTAAAILKMVSKNDPYFPEAKTLEGVILARQGKPESALAAADGTGRREAGRPRPEVRQRDDPEHRPVVLRSGELAPAIEYYARLPGIPSWVDAVRAGVGLFPALRYQRRPCTARCPRISVLPGLVLPGGHTAPGTLLVPDVQVPGRQQADR